MGENNTFEQAPAVSPRSRKVRPGFVGAVALDIGLALTPQAAHGQDLGGVFWGEVTRSLEYDLNREFNNRQQRPYARQYIAQALDNICSQMQQESANASRRRNNAMRYYSDPSVRDAEIANADLDYRSRIRSLYYDFRQTVRSQSTILSDDETQRFLNNSRISAYLYECATVEN